MSWPRVWIAGCGIVGTEIARAHLQAGVPVTLVDRDADAIARSLDSLRLDRSGMTESSGAWGALSGVRVRPADPAPDEESSTEESSAGHLIIESIGERLDWKRAFFQEAFEHFGDCVVLATNTSTLRLSDLAHQAAYARRLAGMHFFMPVCERWAVEVPRHDATSQEVVALIGRHAERLGKTVIAAPDSPGFIVNRMLSPYLNESLLMLCEGVGAETLCDAALDYGMPISPLELIDTIGLRTMFDAGRVYWQAFPKRIDPAPVLARMIKRGRLGRAANGGFFDYRPDPSDGRLRRSQGLGEGVDEIVKRYAREPIDGTVERVRDRLMWTMRIEGECLQREQQVSPETIQDAMAGGLGFKASVSWGERVASIDEHRVAWLLSQAAPHSASLRLPPASA